VAMHVHASILDFVESPRDKLGLLLQSLAKQKYVLHFLRLVRSRKGFC